MKRTMTRLALAAIPVLVAICAYSQTRKYDIKFCTITYDLTQKMAGLDMKNKIVLSFDDYGMKECRETYQGDKLREIYFSDGKNLYSLNPDKKTASKRGEAIRGTEVKVEWSDVSADDKKSGKARQLPAMTIAGKSCDAFAVGLEGSSTTYASWNRVLMMIDMKSKSVNTLKKAVSIDEKTAVPAEKFKIPAGYTLK